MLNKLNMLLQELNIPIAYHHFNKATSLPYVVYYESGSDNVFADNKVLSKCMQVEIELYTEYKDVALETSLENLLNENEIPYEKLIETYIDDEKMFENVYQIELYENNLITSI